MTMSTPSNKVSVSTRDLSLSYGTITVLKKLDIEIYQGEFLVLLGSSGCGKSTLLSCIAGLTDPTEGSVFIGERNVTWLEPSERGIGMVFQSYALYPQMTVRGNLEFGLKNAKTPKAEIAERVKNAADILQIGPFLDRKPSQLSGGQRQRVAIGRALVRDVDVFLFDEPLSNLDAKLRASLRVELKRLHQQLATNTMIYVTHDQVEAMTLADRIAIMKDGKIQQLGTPDDVYSRPNNLYVAQFIGSPSMNILEGQYADGAFTANDFRIPLDGYVYSETAPRARAAHLGIRPEHVLTGRDVEHAPVKFDVVADLVEPMGSDTLVWVQVAGKPFCVRADGQMKVAVGERLTVGVDPGLASLFDAATELRL
jgi:multiple sugar transport system ATP-binding protein